MTDNVLSSYIRGFEEKTFFPSVKWIGFRDGISRTRGSVDKSI